MSLPKRDPQKLQTKEVPPKGFAYGSFVNARGQELRYGQLKSAKKETLGTLVIGPGYSEPIEKYFELVKDLADQGYDVWIMDWAGQGKSERHVKETPQRTYDVPHFLEHHRDDLYKFATEIVKVDPDKKLGFIGCSMGGHIGLKLLEKYPYVFDTASFNAAMFDINTAGYARTFARGLASFLTARGKGHDYIPGGGDWNKLKHVFNKNSKSHDPARHRKFVELMENNPELQVGDPRVQFVRHAMKSIDNLMTPKILNKIQTPIIVSIAGEDTIVSVKAQERAVKHLPNAIQHLYKDARHELWIEADRIRDPWMANMMTFVGAVMRDRRSKPVRLSNQLLRMVPRVDPKKKKGKQPKK